MYGPLKARIGLLNQHKSPRLQCRSCAFPAIKCSQIQIAKTEKPPQALLGLRPRLRSWPPLRDDTPGVLSDAEVWSAQGWLKKGLDSLRRGEIWDFIPSIRYELDAHKGLFWVRLRADSLLELFKALVYDSLRDARFTVRLSTECKRPFVPIRRQAYCSARCSQAVRTRKWRTAHPEKNRAIRRQQYRKSIEAKLELSKGSKIRVGRSHRRSPK